MESAEEKTFRIFAKRLFLTYAQVPEDWNLEFVKRQLLENKFFYKQANELGKSKIGAWLISEERHADGGKHFHCLLEGKAKLHITDARELDFEGMHGNYQAVKDVWSTINYIKKAGAWIGSGFPGLDSKHHNFMNASREDAQWQVFDRMSPDRKLAFKDQLAEKIERRTVIEEVITRAPVYAFQEALMPFYKGSGFLEQGRPMGLVMHGETHSGKTTMAYRVAKELGQDVATYRDPKEMLHHGEEQVILFDEMTRERFESNRGLLAMLVTEPQAKTTSFYASKKVKWPRKVLIATNENVEEWDWDESTRARFIVVKTNADGSYEYKRFKGDRLEAMSKEELAQLRAKAV